MRCFSSPGSLCRRQSHPSVRGCPIRTSQDHWVPAPPLRISSRGHVLRRLQAPRHPPDALLRGFRPRLRGTPRPNGMLRDARGEPPFGSSPQPDIVAMSVSILQGSSAGPGGAAGIRTPDLRRAKAALSQLSYGPPIRSRFPPPLRVGAPGLEPGTSALSGPRSNHLSYAPPPQRSSALPRPLRRCLLYTRGRSRLRCRRRSRFQIPSHLPTTFHPSCPGASIRAVV